MKETLLLCAYGWSSLICSHIQFAMQGKYFRMYQEYQSNRCRNQYTTSIVRLSVQFTICIWKLCTRRSGSWRDKLHLPRVNRLLPHLAYIKVCPSRLVNPRFVSYSLQHPLAPRIAHEVEIKRNEISVVKYFKASRCNVSIIAITMPTFDRV